MKLRDFLRKEVEFSSHWLLVAFAVLLAVLFLAACDRLFAHPGHFESGHDCHRSVDGLHWHVDDDEIGGRCVDIDGRTVRIVEDSLRTYVVPAIFECDRLQQQFFDNLASEWIGGALAVAESAIRKGCW